MGEREAAEREVAGERRAEIARQIGHRLDVGDTSTVEPPENLARVETLMSTRFQRPLERGAFQLGKIRSALGSWHDISRFRRFPRLSMVA